MTLPDDSAELRQQIIACLLDELVKNQRMLRLRDLWERIIEAYDLMPALEHEQLVGLWQGEFLQVLPRGLAMMPEKAEPIVRWVDDPLSTLVEAHKERPDLHLSIDDLAQRCGMSPLKMRVGVLYRARFLAGTNGLFGIDPASGLPQKVALSYEIRLKRETFAERIQREVEALREAGTTAPMIAKGALRMDEGDPRRVFVIHGRNIKARTAVEHFLRSLGLDAVDFDQVAADMGVAFIGDIVKEGMRRARGIVALFTPDEYSCLPPALHGARDGEADRQRWQARPNVIFEAGIAFGTAPHRTILAIMGSDTKLFSDVSGAHLAYLDNTPKARSGLRQKLIGVGCEVDQRTDAWLDASRAGDFDSAIDPLPKVRAPFDVALPAPTLRAVARRPAGLDPSIFLSASAPARPVGRGAPALADGVDGGKTHEGNHADALKDFNRVARAAKDALSALGNVGASAAYADLRGEEWLPSREIWDGYAAEIEKAENSDFIKKSGEGYVLNSSHPKVKKAQKALDDVARIVESEAFSGPAEKIAEDEEMIIDLKNREFFKRFLHPYATLL